MVVGMNIDKRLNNILSLLEGAKLRDIDKYGLNVLIRHYQDCIPVPLSQLAKQRVYELLGLELDWIRRMHVYNGNPSMLGINSMVKKQYGQSTILSYEHIIEVKEIVPELLGLRELSYDAVKQKIDDMTKIVVKLLPEEPGFCGKLAEGLLR